MIMGYHKCTLYLVTRLVDILFYITYIIVCIPFYVFNFCQ